MILPQKAGHCMSLLRVMAGPDLPFSEHLPQNTCICQSFLLLRCGRQSRNVSVQGLRTTSRNGIIQKNGAMSLCLMGGGEPQQMANPRASLSQHLKSASLQHNMASQKPLPLPLMRACAGMPPPSPLYSEWPNKPPNPEANTGFRHSVLGDLLQSEF